MSRSLLSKLLNIKSEENFLNINFSYINNIVENDLFGNTIFLWSIFNCNKLSLYLLLKHKSKLNIDINKPSEYYQKLSPLEALILKGQYKCGIYKDIKQDVNLLDMLLSNKDIDMYYIDNFDLDAMSIALFFYDLDTVIALMKNGFIMRDRHKYILLKYYKHKLTRDFVKFLNKFKGSLVGNENISYTMEYENIEFNRNEIIKIFDIEYVEPILDSDLIKSLKYVDLYCIYKLNIDKSKGYIINALSKYYKHKRFNILLHILKKFH